jgi:NAD(P)-dependent dehydrogenase (short-subunit alcohol dehydrogenase family)
MTKATAVPQASALEGHVAVISGGLGDIGREVALELARAGADIALCDLRPPAEAAKALSELRALGRRARFDQLDVGDALAVEAWVASVEAEWGAPSLIIANAAAVTVAGIQRVTPEEWRQELRTNLDGSFHLAQAAVKRLVAERKPGRVVFIGSWAASTPHPHITAYCVSKAGMRMLCKCMALELAPHGILVNEVAPGFVDAGFSRQQYELYPEAREKNRQQVPLQRLIEAPEVARQVFFLCDPANRHMTGTALTMDGGLSLISTEPAESWR